MGSKFEDGQPNRVMLEQSAWIGGATIAEQWIRLGRVFLMSLENVPVGPPVVTAWHQGPPLGGLRRLFRSLHFGCPLCRTWSAVGASSLGREGDCPHCGRALRLNAFTIDADWRPVAGAWGNPPSASGRQS